MKAYHNAFKELKAILTSLTVIAYFNLELDIKIETDALDRVIRGVLS